MSQELSLPLTGDGTGYLKEAVEEQLALEKEKARKIVEQAQILLSNAEQRSNQLLHDAETATADKLAEAEKVVAEKTATMEASRVARLGEIEKELKQANLNADDTARKKIAGAEKKASHIIEEAMSKVHALVKTAQSKLETAKKESSAMEAKGLKEYTIATTKASELIVDAEEYATAEINSAKEDAETLRLEAETMLAYTQEESRLQIVAATAEANRVADEAAAYQQEVLDWAEAELNSAREKIESFKAFYEDKVARLAALHQSGLSEIKSLDETTFPDGANLRMADEPEEKDTKPSVDETSAVAETVIKPVSEEKSDVIEVDSNEDVDNTFINVEDLEEFEISSDQNEELEAIMSGLESMEDDLLPMDESTSDDSELIQLLDDSESK